MDRAAAGERLADQAEILVHHYGQALDLARSAGDAQPEVESGLTRNLVLAGDRAWQLDTLAAEAYYRRALELSTDEPAHATVLSKLANVLAQRGEMDLAVDAFHAAIAVLRDEDPVGAGIAIKDLRARHGDKETSTSPATLDTKRSRSSRSTQALSLSTRTAARRNGRRSEDDSRRRRGTWRRDWLWLPSSGSPTSWRC